MLQGLLYVGSIDSWIGVGYRSPVTVTCNL